MLIPHTNKVCGKLGLAEYGLPGSQDLGEKIAKVFEDGSDTVILENHGIVVGATDLFKAFKSFETLDFLARIEIKANQIGRTRPLTVDQLNRMEEQTDVDMEDLASVYISSEEKEARRTMAQLIKRAYDQRLFTSTQGTFSQKLDDGSFIITPYNVDRKYMDPEDFVRIEDGRKEPGKRPSRSVKLHELMYKQHPHIQSVIIAHAPNIMAFAVTEEYFDSRTIPESYILLRDIPKHPFASTYDNTEEFAKSFTQDKPVIIVDNECVIATGESLIDAFDRLEVAEYSAKAVIAAKDLGKMVMIDQDKVDELKVAFKLQ